MESVELEKTAEGGGGEVEPPPPATRLPQYVRAAGQRQSLVTPIRCEDSELDPPKSDEQLSKFAGFGVDPGTVELVELQRLRLASEPELPLPTSTTSQGAILNEYERQWRALRFTARDNLDQMDDLLLDRSLLKNYEPQFGGTSETYPSSIDIPAFLQRRIAVEDASAFLLHPYLRFGLGTIEPLDCLVVVYDVSLCCRVTEEFHFTLPGPATGDPGASADLRTALLYILPNHQPQHLYLVLKVSKVLSGDGDSATLPYCNPEKLSSQIEQHKLIDRAVDCSQRLGRYRQPLAWGAMSLMEGRNRPMTLYRQRAAISDEIRIPMIADAVRGTLKEKIVPATCEFDLKRIDDDCIARYKFQQCDPAQSSNNPESIRVRVVDPHSMLSHRPKQTENCSPSVWQEVQPLCHQSMIANLGLTGSGPVAVSYVNVLYVYPLRLDKFQHRNVAVQVQLLDREVTSIGGIDDLRPGVLTALYTTDAAQASRSACTLVSYHQKNPQFENEFKVCLPEHITPHHHILFTFYHVHCKKLLPAQQQEELVGYAVLPILGEDGTVLSDTNYILAVGHAAPPTKHCKAETGIALPPGYVGDARVASADSSKTTTFSCRTRTFSSVYSQDKWISQLLSPSQSVDAPVSSNDEIIAALVNLRQAHPVHLRYFLLSVVRIVLGYFRLGPATVRWAAFRALLAIFEKVSWSPHRSLKPHQQDLNMILQYFVQIIYDEDVSTNCLRREDGVCMPLYRAIHKEWLHVLQDKSPSEDVAETKRISLTFAHFLVQLSLKSMAMTLLSGKRGTKYVPKPNREIKQLPQRIPREDELLIERLASELTQSSGNTSMGLLLQKEANQSLAWLCRGLFLVALNSVPARIIAQYMDAIERTKSDPNTLVHLLFPFLHTLIDFELFPVVNYAISSEERSLKADSAWTFERSWLAKTIFRVLLKVIDDQKEPEISCGSARLLRRFFVVHAYNPLYQKAQQQQAISLAYISFLRYLAEFTAEHKLFAVDENIFQGNREDSTSKRFQLKKELLICVSHILSSVSNSEIPQFFGAFEVAKENRVGTIITTWQHSSALSPTSALIYYRRVVSERKTRASMFQISESPQCGRRASTTSAYKLAPFDEVRVHASLALVKNMIDIFLMEEENSVAVKQTWRYFLSPVMGASEGLTSLQELENQIRHRGSHHRGSGGSIDDPNITQRRPQVMSTSSPSLQTNTRLSHSGSLPNATSSSTICRTPIQRSMPRSWSKNYGISQQKRSATDTLSPDPKSASFPFGIAKAAVSNPLKKCSSPEPLEDRDLQNFVVNMRQIITKTALQTLETAVKQFEHILRLIEIPFDSKRGLSSSTIDPTTTIDQAYALLGSITELLFFLLCRVTKMDDFASQNQLEIDEANPEHAIAIDILSYIMAFLRRFQTALFACRIPGLPLIHDVTRVRQIITIACSSSSTAVRRHTASLLASLVLTCYAQTGSFTLMKIAIQTVVTAAIFPSNQDQSTLPLDALRELIEEMRHFCQQECKTFQIQMSDFLNSITTHIKVYEMWRNALSTPDLAHDFEDIEDGLFHAYESVSELTLLKEKQAWLHALLRLHISRKNFAEAVICKLSSIEAEEKAVGIFKSAENVQQQSVVELMQAREFAELANWLDKEMIICEQLLARLRDAKQYVEYQFILKRLDAVVSKLMPTEIGETELSYAFYRVKFAGEAVPPRIAKCEYIYKRNVFTSVGEFVGEMKAMVRAKFPSCERVDIVPEAKPLPANEDHPNVIFLRVSSVEKVHEMPLRPHQKLNNRGAVFKLSTPFTLSGSGSYAKTAEQLKRVIYMTVKFEFPCALNRQLVCDRVEIVRCPIETAMDDISKRCMLLRDEIRKEIGNRTDLKTLTLVLKGSVDTHVHGGIPEVVDSFLASSSCDDSKSDKGKLPTLLTSTGTAMDDENADIKRHELANLLIEFVVLCCRCLLIGRDAFRRSATPTGSSASPPSGSVSAASSSKASYDALATLANETKTAEILARVQTSPAPPAASSGVAPTDPKTIDDWLVALLPDPSSSSPAPGCLPDGASASSSESPLQQELERSFGALVLLLGDKIRFPFARSAVLPALLRRLDSLHLLPGSSTK